MFHHLFSTIAALILITAHTPPQEPLRPNQLFSDILFSIFLFFLFIALWNRRTMAGVREEAESFPSDSTQKRMQMQTLSLLLFFAFLIHGLHLPLLVCPEVLAAHLPFIRDLGSVLVYFLLQGGLWFLGAAAMGIRNPREKKDFIREQMGLSLPALLPWLLFSGFHDLLLLLPSPGFQEIFRSPMGQNLYLIALFTAIFLFAPVGIQRFWKCRPLPQGALRQRIEGVLHHTGTAFRDILVWPLFGGRMLTAGVMGPWARFRYILVTPALLRSLYPEALEAVIAHEAGHVQRHHLLLHVLILAGFMLASWAFMDFFYQALLLGAMRFVLPHTALISPASLATGIAISLSLMFFLFYFRFVFGFFMRNFERQADAFAFRMQGSARHLIETFHLLAHMTGQHPEKPNWHHFSIGERIRFLIRCENTPRIAEQHDQRVRRMLLLYLGALVLMAVAGGYLHAGGGMDGVQSALFMTSLEMEAEKDGDNPLLLRYLGDLYQEKRRWKEARSVYQKALLLAPEDGELLNNLAWLCITADDPATADPALGVYLAEKAVMKTPDKPHVLDTLAEGYYRTDRMEDALRTGKKALLLQQEEGRDTGYYADQVKKFMQAAEKKKPAI